MTIQINSCYRFRILKQIVDRVAPAGRDRQNARILIEPEGLNIDSRIFPYLVVNKRVEPDREHLLEYALAGAEALGLNSGLYVCHFEMLSRMTGQYHLR